MTDDIEQTTVEDMAEAVQDTVESGTRTLTRAAEIVGTEVTGTALTAIVGAIDRQGASLNRVIQLLEAQSNMVQENLNALSRAQANTDVSAQRAAESATTIAEELTPEDKSKPNEGEQPEAVKELPRNQQSEAQAYKLGFGKAAARHGR